jgi:SPX domain protein involved in polyphosphate accumulation
MRFERKYRIENLSLSHVLQIIKAHPASFSTLYPDRRVNNIYFDTPNFECLNDNLAGVNYRKKYRIRWYGEEMQQLKNPQLEVKYKENMLGGKTVLALEDLELNDLMNIKAVVNQKINYKSLLSPVLLNSYYRSYWTTADRKFRITVDSKMGFHSLYHSPFFQQYMHMDDAIILELKYEQEDEEELERINTFLPFRLSKNSKYVNGILLSR